MMFRVLGKPRFFLLWISQVLSTIGDSLYQIAIILIAVKIAGSGAGFVGAAEAGTYFIFGLLGGVYADRWNRRWTMFSVDVLRALVVLLLALLALTPYLRVYHLIIVSILVGFLGSFFDPSLQASLPILAREKTILQSLNALMDMTRRLARIIGPLLAGLLIGFLPLAHFFTLDSISFLISAFAIFALGNKFIWKVNRHSDTQQKNASIIQEMREALLLLWSYHSLRWALIIHGVTSALWRAAFILGAALFATRMLSGNGASYGLMVSAYGVGSLVTSLALGNFSIQRQTALMFTGKIILGAGFLLMISTTNLLIVLAGAVLAGLGGPFFDIMISLIIQSHLPADQIGKISSVRFLMEDAGNFFGLLIGVPLFAILSIPLGIGLCALIIFATGLFGLLCFGLRESFLSLPSGD